MDFLEEFSLSNKPSCIIITETWANVVNIDAEFQMANYTLYRRDRKRGRGGGVMVYVSNAYKSWLVQESESVEALWVGIQATVLEKLVLGAFYRPPNAAQHVNEQISAEMTHGCQSLPFPHCVIAGDFNTPTINWKRGSFTKASEWLYDCANKNNLEQVINVATHIKGNTLDLLFTKEKDAVSSVKILPPLSNSDHFIIHTDFSFRASTFKNQREQGRYNFRKANWPLFKSLIEKQNWATAFQENSISSSWDKFEKVVKECLDSSVPFTTRNHNPKGQSKFPSWYTKKVEKSAKRKKRAFQKMKKCSTFVSKEIYKDQNKKHKQNVISAVRNYENYLASEVKNGNSKTFWAYVNAKTKSRSSEISLKCGSQITSDSLECAELLAEQFSSVFSAPEALPHLPHLPDCSALDTVIFDQNRIASVLKSKGDFSSPGPDGIPYIVYKKGGPVLLQTLAMLFQRSLREGKLPAAWKKSTVVPIYKGKGSKSDPSNYRPISLTSSAAKLMESIIREDLYAFVTANNLLRNTQHGFRPGYSCNSQLIHFFNFVTAAHNLGDSVDCIYLDFSKAFDTVPHGRLLFKLHQQFHIVGHLFKWLQDFLSDRSFSVLSNGKHSAERPVHSGVPQGSVLGPILFCLFVNDIDDQLRTSSILKFADDIKLFSIISDSDDGLARRNLQMDLDRIFRWAEAWGLRLNPQKCVAMNLHSRRGKRQPDPSYTLGGAPLLLSEAYKDLGVWVTPFLDFSKHCSVAAGKAEQAVRLIRRKFKSRRPDTLIPLFNAFARPHLEYCSSAIVPYKKADFHRLEKPIRSFSKVFPAFRNRNYQERLEQLKIPSWKQMRTSADLKVTRKIILDRFPVPKEDFFKFAAQNRTRCKNQWKLERERRGAPIRSHFLSNRIVDSWNSLPQSTILENDTIFATNLRIILNSCPPSINPF